MTGGRSGPYLEYDRPAVSTERHELLHPRSRATFDPIDLAVVLSHYDLGVIESITDLVRGSRRSAKIGIVAERGKFVLKQRPAFRARPERIAFSHQVQAVLAAGGFPMPKVIPTRADRPAGPWPSEGSGRRMHVEHRDLVYELFEFVPGHPYGRTAAEAKHAGEVLSRLHDLTRDFPQNHARPAPEGDYHDAPGVRVGLCSIGSTLASHDSFSGEEAELATLIQFLLEGYDRAAEAVNRLGFATWPERVVHADYHPGNLLFRDGKVLAVVDYDSVRRSRWVTDVANGSLHFSILAGEDPTSWPDHLDETLFHRFLEGYESHEPLSPDERRSLPHLMAEALIAECVPPITETGSVGRWSGFRILQMVRRKLNWLEANGPRLIAGLPGPG